MAAVTALSQGISTHDRLTQKVGDLFEETALLSSRPRRPKQINTNPPFPSFPLLSEIIKKKRMTTKKTRPSSSLLRV